MASLDPHLHAPGTLQADEYPSTDSWELYLQAPESASPVIRTTGVTDYCVTRSYELVRAAKEQGRLKDCSLLFPNIELRLNTRTVKGNFVNIHLLASPDDPNHVFELNRFLGRLVFSGSSDKFRQDSARRHDRSRLRFRSALRAPIVGARPNIWRALP